MKISIDKMETSKLDKEILEDSLAGKADTIMMNRKVSYEQFDVTCNEMNSALNMTLKRLNDQVFFLLASSNLLKKYFVLLFTWISLVILTCRELQVFKSKITSIAIITTVITIVLYNVTPQFYSSV